MARSFLICYHCPRMKNALKELAKTANNIEKNVSRIIVRKEKRIHLLTLRLCSGLHVLIQDIPGMGKQPLHAHLQKA